jgi:hypothetical protein
MGKCHVTEEKVSHKIKWSANLRTFNMVNIVPCRWISEQQRISQKRERKCSCCETKFWKGDKWNTLLALKICGEPVNLKMLPGVAHLGPWFPFYQFICLFQVLNVEVYEHKLNLNPTEILKLPSKITLQNPNPLLILCILILCLVRNGKKDC